MSSRPSTEEVVRALHELGNGAVPVEEIGRAGYRRERVVRAIERRIGSAHTARPRHTRLWLGVAAAALALLGVGVTVSLLDQPARTAAVAKAPAGEVRSLVGDVSIRRGDSPARAASVGDLFEGGESVRTGVGARLEIGIESGHAKLGAESDLEIVQPSSVERRMRLGKGGVEVDLPSKLAPGQHLVIETADADVLVVGTAFSVDVRPEGGQNVTVVEVRRGTVWIQREGQQKAVLHAGEAWRSRARVEAPAAVPAAESEVAAAPRRALRAPSGTAPRARESGTLAEENRLFEAALSARNAGQYTAAAEQFRTLLARYPGSILAEQALAGQFRSLERAGRLSTAVAAARRYLASYPQGFAHADAERLTGSPLDAR